MEISLHVSGFSGSGSGVREFQSVVATALTKFERRIRSVKLVVEDVNGPRGGVDKQCRCVVHLNRMLPIVIEDQDENLRNLIYRVANRAAYTLSHKLERRLRRNRSSAAGPEQQLEA